MILDLDRLDPDWTFAETHGRANRAGLAPDFTQNQGNIRICPCCYEYVQKQPLSMCQNSKQLQFLGLGFPLFYAFLKSCIVYLIISIITYNAMSLQQALQSNYDICHKTSQDTTTTPSNSTLHSQTNLTHRFLSSTSQNILPPKHCYTFLIQLSRIQDIVTLEEESLRVVSFVGLMLALVFIRHRMINLQAYYDQRTTSLSDYAILIRGLPMISGIQNKLKQFFKKQFKNQHQIQQITLLSQYEEIQKLQKQKHKIIQQLRIHYDKQSRQNQCSQAIDLQNDLQMIKKKLTAAAMVVKQLANKDQLLCTRSICVFNTDKQKQEILNQFKGVSQENKQKYFGSKSSLTLRIKEAPEPQQIIWENAHIHMNKRSLSILLGWSLSFILLVAVFVAFYFILQAKSMKLEESLAELQIHKDEQQYLTQYRGALALVYILMFLVVIFDKTILAILFHKFTDFEKHRSAARLQFSFALKLCLGLFFTTALMTLAVQAIRFKNYYSHPYGVIEEESIMFFMNSFFVPFFWLVNPMRIFKQIKRKLNYGKRSLTQQQANRLMEEDHYDMGKRFAEVLEMMWFTFLYSSLIPIGAVLTCVGLMCYYWVDKYNLLRRSSVSRQISGKLLNSSLTLLDITLILRPIGEIIFDTQIRDRYLPSTVIMICCAFVYIIIPKDRLLTVLNNQKFRLETKTYEQMKHIFHKTYHTEHPIYRIIYERKLTQRMLKRGLSFQNFHRKGSSTFIPLAGSSENIIKQKVGGELDLGIDNAA